MKFTLAIVALATAVVALEDGGLADLKAQFPQYFQGVTGIHVPAQYAGPSRPLRPTVAVSTSKSVVIRRLTDHFSWFFAI